MLEGRCPKCGAGYCGWALESPCYQICGNCGSHLDISDGGRHSFTGYSLFNVREQPINRQTPLWPPASGCN